MNHKYPIMHTHAKLTKVLMYRDNNIGLNFTDSTKVRKSKLGLDIWVWFEGDHHACINFGLVLTL